VQLHQHAVIEIRPEGFLYDGGVLSSICCRGEATGAHQTPVLHIAIVLGREDLDATLAFLLAADKAHDAIDGDGIAPFIEPLDHDIILHRG
jgi:hypothetical protein